MKMMWSELEKSYDDDDMDCLRSKRIFIHAWKWNFVSCILERFVTGKSLEKEEDFWNFSISLTFAHERCRIQQNISHNNNNCHTWKVKKKLGEALKMCT